MVRLTKKRRRRGKEESGNDFNAILSLSEDLTKVLMLMLHLKKEHLSPALDKMRSGRAYELITLSKGRGKGKRYIDAPCEELKFIQRRILDNFLMGIPVHFCRHNVRGSSIFTNVDHHKRASSPHILTIDLIKAFPSVKRERIESNLWRPLVRKLREFGKTFTEEEEGHLVRALADLVCYKDRLPFKSQRLPQGPPTSPRILDIVCWTLDVAIFRFLQSQAGPLTEYRFTAYSDDLTISYDNPIPEDVKDAIVEIIRKHGFIAHSRRDKFEYFSPETGKVPVITGLALHPDRIMLTPRKARQFQGTLHMLLKKKHWDESDRGTIAGILGFIDQIGGESIPGRMKKEVAQAKLRLSAHSSALHSVQADHHAKGKMNKRSKRKLLHQREQAELQRIQDESGIPETVSQPKRKRRKKKKN